MTADEYSDYQGKQVRLVLDGGAGVRALPVIGGRLEKETDTHLELTNVNVWVGCTRDAMVGKRGSFRKDYIIGVFELEK